MQCLGHYSVFQVKFPVIIQQFVIFRLIPDGNQAKHLIRALALRRTGKGVFHQPVAFFDLSGQDQLS